MSDQDGDTLTVGATAAVRLYTVTANDGINDQWRVCFEWPEGSPGPTDVEIVDDH